MRKIWEGFAIIVESCLTRIGNFVLGFFKPFWSWLKRILYPYRYLIFAADVILIILLVVLMICSSRSISMPVPNRNHATPPRKDSE